MVEIEINGKKVAAEPGAMIIEVADNHEVRIPRFCYHKKLTVAANCRMCLVEVGDARKPMPACATPVSQGMKVFTRSKMALDAQRAVMEFLLINHPLDCPVCDQGGECELQDLAVGYGRDISRFHLGKRAVGNQNIGPLIETEMTRCIHCTRCVRFGKEVAGLHELGVMNRGEHLEISTFVSRAVASELSGNMIDLCPVGALTSKPYRFSARAWELAQRPSIGAHDCVGSHIAGHVIHNEVKRVVPRDCEAINETWASDRDRFSYEGLYHSDRVLSPKIKQKGEWRDTDWPTALQFAADKIIEASGELGALASANSTNEEFYLLQKLLRGVDVHNIDYRLQQQDFSDDKKQNTFPHAGVAIADIVKADTIFLVGSRVNHEQPIIAHRIRMATQNNATVLVLNPIDFPFHFKVESKHIVVGGDLVQGLASVVKALVESQSIKTDATLSAFLKNITVNDAAKQQATLLQQAKQGVMLLGALALHHPQAATLRALASVISANTNVTLGLLTSGANAAGGYLMGALPLANGLNAKQMLTSPLHTLLLLGVEPEYDSADPHQALETLAKTQNVIALSAYQTPHLLQYAHVILPITPAAEMAGTFVNAEGRWQAFSAMTNPKGESRPAWKVLRVLANILDLEDFSYQTLEDVQLAIGALNIQREPQALQFTFTAPDNQLPEGIIRIGGVPIYAQDNVVRRANALQETPLAAFSGVHMNRAQASALGLEKATRVNVRQYKQVLHLPLVLDETVPMGAVYLAAGIHHTLGLGASYQAIQLESGNDYA